MSENESRYREALARIAEIAQEAAHSHGSTEDRRDQGEEYGGNGADRGSRTIVGCTLKSLPSRLLMEAAQTAVTINPVNAPMFGPAVEASADLVSDPLFIAAITSKYWGPTERTLTVSFMGATPGNLRARIVSHLNAWTRTAGIRFAETQGTGIVRISRGPGGYWSYLGTDILHIAPSHPTMNLQDFTMNTPESEFRRVIRHEAGHTLGFPHEHMRRDLVARIDRQRAYEYFRRTQGWDQATVDRQVLTPLDEHSILSTPADQTSIMSYHLPASITRDGRPILGGSDINETDYAFAGRIYPQSGQQQSDTQEGIRSQDEEGFLDKAAAC